MLKSSLRNKRLYRCSANRIAHNSNRHIGQTITQSTTEVISHSRPLTSVLYVLSRLPRSLFVILMIIHLSEHILRPCRFIRLGNRLHHIGS